MEHFVFRKSRFDLYNVEDLDQPPKLPLGVSATVAFLWAFGAIIPSMSQTFYRLGPIAEAGPGDIGIYTGTVSVWRT
jgi:purine-cytosine permease-like protein